MINIIKSINSNLRIFLNTPRVFRKVPIEYNKLCLETQKREQNYLIFFSFLFKLCQGNLYQAPQPLVKNRLFLKLKVKDTENVHSV